MKSSSQPEFENRRFATTQWTCVVQAAQQDSSQSRPALEKLCGMYWYPLYAFVRRKGHSADEAADLTQGFFLHLLEGARLELCDQSRGKFRSFLMTSMSHFITSHWRHEKAQKRGGGQSILSIDYELADRRFQNEPSDETTPEDHFDRQWAMSILAQAMQQLRDSYQQSGKQKLFDALQSRIGGKTDSESYQQIGENLGMSENAIKVAIHRIRERYRKQIRTLVADTLNLGSESPETREKQVDEEIQNLFSILRQ